MNFNLFLLAIILTTTACGVKGPPVAPAGTSIPSYTDQFLDKEKQDKQAESDEEKEEEQRVKP